MAISRSTCNYLILFVFISIIFFGCSNETDKAKSFITAGMYPQAIELLNKRIQEKPTDAEAQFQLGVCFINTGNISESNKRFGSAVKLNADYGYQIGAEYKKAGIEALKQNNLKQAEINFNQAIHYQPKLKSSICDELKNIAETNLNLINLNLQNIEKANNTYQILARLNPSLNAEIAQKHLALFNEAKDEKFKSIIIDNAIKFSQQESITKAYADYHYDLSKLAKSTKDAISELKIANKFEDYEPELQKKLEQLKQEKLQKIINKFSIKYGRKPDIDKLLTDNEDFITVFKNPKLNDGFLYLASSNFIGFDDAGPAEYPAALKNPKTIEYTGYKYINGALKIKKKDNNVRVAVWKLNNS
ncbi:MAG: hypothetical protein JJV89_02730 [Desulfosarcina sp.]|nr:hypothetical protein [Desulfobacterales bacterium]